MAMAARMVSSIRRATRQVHTSRIQKPHTMEDHRGIAVRQWHMQLSGTGRVSMTGKEGIIPTPTVGQVITEMATGVPMAMAIRRMQLHWQRSLPHLPTCCVSPATPRRQAPTKYTLC